MQCCIFDCYEKRLREVIRPNTRNGHIVHNYYDTFFNVGFHNTREENKVFFLIIRVFTKNGLIRYI